MDKSFSLILMILVCLMGYLYVREIYSEDTKAVYECVANNYEQKMVAITFDDGPGRGSTQTLLDGLKERNVVATFFLVGENILNNQDIVLRMKNEGHLIGNHTFSHVELSKIPCYEALEEVKKTNKLIKEITGEEPEFIRPPCGSWNKELFFAINMTPVLWTVDPLDWKRCDVNGIVNDVVNNVQDGSIILLHDIYNTSVEAALEIIDILKAQGYLFVTVEEILIM